MEKVIPILGNAETQGSRRAKLWAFFGGLGKSAFVRNIAIVMTGTAVAQIIAFGLSPVISRLFSPVDFGIAGSFAAVASVFGTIVTLQYSQAIILPKAEADAINLLAISCLCTLVFSLLCVAGCMMAPTALNGLMKTTGIWALGLLVCATLVTGANQSLQSWCIRVKAFKHTSASQVVRSLGSSGVQLGSGGLKLGSLGLVCSGVLADILASVNLGRVVLRDWRRLGGAVEWQSMRRLALEYRDFPLYNASTTLINTLSLGLPLLLLSHFYGLPVAGAYAFAMRILSTPMGFVLSALRQVLLQKAAETHNEGRQLMPLYAKISAGLFALALLPSLGLLTWGIPLFAWLFGPQWTLAGEFASSLVIWLLFMFCNLPASLFGRIIRIQHQMFLFDAAVLLLRTASLYFGGIYLSASSTILLFACVGGVLNIYFIGLVGYKLWKAETDKQIINVTAI
jgi:lipopolysaccharide exporter